LRASKSAENQSKPFNELVNWAIGPSTLRPVSCEDNVCTKLKAHVLPMGVTYTCVLDLSSLSNTAC